MKLLLIEDEKRAAAYLEQGLSEHGYAVELGTTARMACMPPPAVTTT